MSNRNVGNCLSPYSTPDEELRLISLPHIRALRMLEEEDRTKSRFFLDGGNEIFWDTINRASKDSRKSYRGSDGSYSIPIESLSGTLRERSAAGLDLCQLAGGAGIITPENKPLFYQILKQCFSNCPNLITTQAKAFNY